MATNIEIQTGEKNGRKWEGIRVNIGEWSVLVFPKTQFEMNYIKKVLGEQAQK